MKHKHNWLPLYHPADTQESRLDFLLLGRRREYLQCECGAVGAPSHGSTSRIILLADGEDWGRDAEGWNSRQKGV